MTARCWNTGKEEKIQSKHKRCARPGVSVGEHARNRPGEEHGKGSNCAPRRTVGPAGVHSSLSDPSRAISSSAQEGLSSRCGSCCLLLLPRCGATRQPTNEQPTNDNGLRRMMTTDQSRPRRDTYSLRAATDNRPNPTGRAIPSKETTWRPSGRVLMTITLRL